MLMIMENTEEIFRAWLKKYVKDDKKITGRELSKKLGVPPPTVTAWHSGRKNDKGEKYFPHISFEIQKKIIGITGVAESQILKEGREILSPKDKKTTGTPTCATCQEHIFKLNDPLEAEHLTIIRQFKSKHMACALNKLLVELEELDDTELADVVTHVKNRIKALKESSKKRTSNGED